MRPYWLIFILSLLISVSVSGQEALTESEETSQDSLKCDPYFAALPVVFFLPETGLAFGGLGIYTFQLPGEPKSSRTSTVNLALVYTLKKQLLVFSAFDLFKRNNDMRIRGEFGYYRYIYNYYGRGENSLEEDLEIYSVNYPRFEIEVTHKITDNIAIGPSFKTDYYAISDVVEGGLVEQTNFYQGDLRKVTQLGLTTIFDTRDFVISPSAGTYIELLLSRSSEGLFSDVNYNQLLLRAQYFKEIKEDHILAFASYLGSSEDSTPFYKYFYVGASNRGRGIQDRRYMDTNIFNLLGEYRFKVKGKWGGVVFAGATNVKSNFDNLFQLPNILNVGLGARYRLSYDQRVRLRLDAGYSEGSVAFYLTLNDAF